MQVTHALDGQDLEALGRHIPRRWGNARVYGLLLLMALPAVLMAAIRGSWIVAVSVVMVTLAGTTLLIWRNRRSEKVAKNDPVTYRLSPEFFEIEGKDYASRIRWSGLDEVGEFEGRLFVRRDLHFWIIPRAAFGSPTDAEAFLQEAQSSLRQASPAQDPLGDPPRRDPAGVETDVVFHMTRLDDETVNERVAGRMLTHPLVSAMARTFVLLAGLFVGLVLPGLISLLLGQIIVTTVFCLIVASVDRRIVWSIHGAHRTFAAPRRMQLTTGVIAVTTAFEEHDTLWDAIESVEHDEHANFLFLSRRPPSAFLLRRRFFPTDADFEWCHVFASQCHAAMLERKKAAEAQSAEERPTVEPEPIAAPRETGNPYQPPQGQDLAEPERP